MNKDYIISKLSKYDSEVFYVGEIFFMDNGEVKLTKEAAIELIETRDLHTLKDCISRKDNYYTESKKIYESWIGLKKLDKLLEVKLLENSSSTEFSPDVEDYRNFLTNNSQFNFQLRLTYKTHLNRLKDINITGIQYNGKVDFDLINVFLQFRDADDFIIKHNELKAYYI